MITQPSWRKGALLRKFVLGAHPIIEHYLQRLRVGELIATYIPQDQRIQLPIERTLSVLIHNILTTPMPMYAIADWLAPLDEQSLGLEPADAGCIHDDRVGQALDRFYDGRHKGLRSVPYRDGMTAATRTSSSTWPCGPSRPSAWIAPRSIRTPPR